MGDLMHDVLEKGKLFFTKALTNRAKPWMCLLK